MMPGVLAAAGQRRRAALLAALALLQAAAVAAGAAGTRAAFAGLERTGQVPMPALGGILLAGLGLAFLRPALRMTGEAIGQAYAGTVRQALFEHATRSDPRALAARRRGYLLMRVTGDMTALRDGVARGLPPVVQAATLAPAALAVLAMIDTRTAGLAGLVCIACASCLILSLPALDQAQRRLRARRARLAAEMAERLPLAPELAVLGRRRREKRRIRRLSGDLAAGALGWLMRTESLHALPGALTAVLAAWTLHDGAGRGMVAGDLAAMLAAIGVLTLAFRDLTGATGRIVAFRAARERTRAALARPIRGDIAGGRRLRRGPLSIEIDDPGNLLLAKPRLDVKAGLTRSEAVTDPARLAQILTRRADPPGLRIRLGGIPLKDVSPGSIRRGVEVICAEPPLIRGSLRRCLTLGDSRRADDARLLSRIERAGLGPALARLGGLNAKIEEGGRLHSSADRIRIAGLRAAVRRPGLILVVSPADAIPDEIRRFLETAPATRLWLRHANSVGHEEAGTVDIA